MSNPIPRAQQDVVLYLLRHGQCRGDRQRLWSLLYLLDAISFAETGEGATEIPWVAGISGPEPEAGTVVAEDRLQDLGNPEFQGRLSEYLAGWLGYLTTELSESELEPAVLPGWPARNRAIGRRLPYAGAFDATPFGKQRKREASAQQKALRWGRSIHTEAAGGFVENENHDQGDGGLPANPASAGTGSLATGKGLPDDLPPGLRSIWRTGP